MDYYKIVIKTDSDFQGLKELVKTNRITYGIGYEMLCKDNHFYYFKNYNEGRGFEVIIPVNFSNTIIWCNIGYDWRGYNIVGEIKCFKSLLEL